MELKSQDWSPFRVVPSSKRPKGPRSIDTLAGVGDRLRSAAFAEIQAKEAFFWASQYFIEERPSLKAAWRGLALAEEKHLNWLLRRMKELKIEVTGRPVSDFLWQSFMNARNAEEFSLYMARAEQRGQEAGYRFHEALKESDSVTAEIFLQIADEEEGHIALARKFFPEKALTALDFTGKVHRPIL